MHVLAASTVAMIATIGGLVVPPVTSLLKQAKWGASVKQLIAALASCVVAIAAVYVTAPADFAGSFVALASIVFAASQAVYGLYFKGSTVEGKLSSVFAPKPAPPETTATPAA